MGKQFLKLITSLLLLAVTFTKAKDLEQSNHFKEYLQATCKQLSQICVSDSECCSNSCTLGLCVTCIPSETTPLLTCDRNNVCCSSCCLYDYCRAEQDCLRSCVDSSTNSYCDEDDQCCSGCCSSNTCVKTGTVSHCTGSKVTSNAWFIIFIFVLLPIAVISVLIILGIFCYKKQQRKEKFNQAQQEYLERTSMLAS